MKTEKDMKLDAVLDRYYDLFGENYPLCITSLMTTEEIIEDVEKYIEKGEPKPDNDLDSNLVY